MAGWISTLIKYMVIGLFVTGVVVFGYDQWRVTTERAATAEQAQKQLAQAVSDLQRTNQQLMSVMRMADQVREDLARKEMELQMSSDQINRTIDQAKDQGSSQVLRDTVGELRARGK